jgi:hypothetical protein
MALTWLPLSGLGELPATRVFSLRVLSYSLDRLESQHESSSTRHDPGRALSGLRTSAAFPHLRRLAAIMSDM